MLLGKGIKVRRKQDELSVRVMEIPLANARNLTHALFIDFFLSGTQQLSITNKRSLVILK